MKPNDAFIPKQKVVNDPETLQFEKGRLSNEHWANTTRVRVIFHKAFIAVGLPKCHPHTLRNTITIWAMGNCTQLQFKAISQSLGHEHAMMSYNYYGTLPHHDLRKAFASIGKGSAELGHLSTEALWAELKGRN